MDDAAAGRQRRRPVVPLLLWLVFCLGLMLQAFSPHLAIEHNQFVIPADVMSRGSAVDPRALVNRQRFMEGASAALVLVGAVGLGIWYRDELLRNLSRK